MKPFIVLLLIAASLAGCSRERVELTVKVGDDAPDFVLEDQDGSKTSLDDLLSKKQFVAIVFFRSADW